MLREQGMFFRDIESKYLTKSLSTLDEAFRHIRSPSIPSILW